MQLCGRTRQAYDQNRCRLLRVYTDEDVHSFIAQALRIRGWETLTTVEANRLSASDEDQLKFATASGYSLLTYNVGDFARLHDAQLSTGQSHTGIIVATQGNPRRNVRALLNLLNLQTAEEIESNLVYLSNWHDF